MGKEDKPGGKPPAENAKGVLLWTFTEFADHKGRLPAGFETWLGQDRWESRTLTDWEALLLKMESRRIPAEP